MTPHEQISAYVMRNYGARLSPAEIARPWTYLHREWTDQDGERCSQRTGVSIQRDEGLPLRINVAEMQDFPR